MANVFSEALAACVRVGGEEVADVIEILNPRMDPGKQMEVYGNAIILVASEGDIDGLGALEEAYPDQDDVSELMQVTLLKAALENKADAVSNIMAYLEDDIRAELTVPTLEAIASAKDLEAFVAVKEACSEHQGIEGPLAEALRNRAKDGDAESVTFLSESLSQSERRAVLP